MSSAKTKFINYMNSLYYHPLDDISTLRLIYKYIAKNINQKDNLLNWLDDDKIKFNNSNKANIIDLAKHIVNGDHIEFNQSDIAKEYLYKKIINDKVIISPILNRYLNWLYGDNFGKCNILEMNKQYGFGDHERMTFDKDIFFDSCDSLMRNKYSDKMVCLSDICYFKCAVNCILYHPIFQNMVKFDNDRPRFDKHHKEKYHSLIDKQIRSVELWKLLKNNSDTFIIVDVYNNIINNEYLIGRPGVKYYPHQIIQELLHYLNNMLSSRFYYDNHYVQIINELKYDMDRDIEELLNNWSLMSIFIAPIIDDPFKNYVFSNSINANEIIEEIKNNPNKSIDDILKDDAIIKIQDVIKNNKIYKYKYFIGKYYLTSFCIIENRPNDNIPFHCIFIQIKYDYEFNITEINRYDNTKITYPYKENEIRNVYLPYEGMIFNKDYVSDYYDGEHNYKICLVCYSRRHINFIIPK